MGFRLERYFPSSKRDSSPLSRVQQECLHVRLFPVLLVLSSTTTVQKSGHFYKIRFGITIIRRGYSCDLHSGSVATAIKPVRATRCGNLSFSSFRILEYMSFSLSDIFVEYLKKSNFLNVKINLFYWFFFQKLYTRHPYFDISEFSCCELETVETVVLKRYGRKRMHCQYSLICVPLSSNGVCV